MTWHPGSVHRPLVAAADDTQVFNAQTTTEECSGMWMKNRRPKRAGAVHSFNYSLHLHR